MSRLSFSQRQMVEIARVLYTALHTDRQVIVILDEPTAVLSPSEVENLFAIINSLREQAAFIFISHHLEEIVEYTDRVAVMKDGSNVGDVMTRDVDIRILQEMMVGREFSTDFFFAQELRVPEDEVVLRLEGVTNKEVKDVSFSLRKGGDSGDRGADGMRQGGPLQNHLWGLSGGEGDDHRRRRQPAGQQHCPGGKGGDRLSAQRPAQ